MLVVFPFWRLEWCKPGQYVCPNSKVCIDQRAVCDGIPDCPVGGEDERNCVALAHHVDANEEVTYSSSGKWSSGAVPNHSQQNCT